MSSIQVLTVEAGKNVILYLPSYNIENINDEGAGIFLFCFWL